MKLSTAVPLLIGLCLIAVLARPMIEFGEERAAADNRRTEMNSLLQRLDTSPLPDSAAHAQSLREQLGDEAPTEDQVARVRELVTAANPAQPLEAAP